MTFPRPGETRDESEPNRIGKTHSDDGDRPRGVLRCQGCRRRRRYEDVHLEPDQLGREIGQPVESALRPSILDDDVLALDPPELTQPLPERLADAGISGVRAGGEIAYPGHLPHLLRPGGERRGEEAAGQRTQERPAIHGRSPPSFFRAVSRRSRIASSRLAEARC